MATNDFSKQALVAFEEQIAPGFDDRLVMSKKVRKHTTSGKEMKRAGDVIWRPMKYISPSYDGMDATNNYKVTTQLSVPATLGFHKHATYTADAKEMRDDLDAGRFGEAAAQKLASDINIAVMDTICNQATKIYTKSSAAADYGDVAALESIFNRVGIDYEGRQVAYSTVDYNGLAKDLASRQTMTGKPVTAYERSLIGESVAGFVANKLDYANICNDAAGSGLTMSTLAGASNFHTPKATTEGSSGWSNYDNRYQQITVSANTGVLAGDFFTIDGVYEVHMITKRSTGNLMTFRVISTSSTDKLVISPPIISNQGSTAAEVQYQNCTIPTPASNAALVWLNTTAKPMNPFWIEGAVELLPASLAIPEGAGVKVSRATTAQGIEIAMTEYVSGDTLKYRCRWDVFFGVVVLQPEMVGVELFSQT